MTRKLPHKYIYREPSGHPFSTEYSVSWSCFYQGKRHGRYISYSDPDYKYQALRKLVYLKQNFYTLIDELGNLQ